MHQDTHVRIRGQRRSKPDVRKLSRALLALALAEARAEQEAQAQQPEQPERQERTGGKKAEDAPRRSV